MRLDELPAGQPATIAAIDWTLLDAPAARRLRELGFDEGVSVELLHRAAFGGDPIAFRLGRMMIAIRRAQARAVRVEMAQEYPVAAE